MVAVPSPQQMVLDGVGDDVFVTPPAAYMPGPVVRVGGELFETTPVFDTYWRFAAQRQQVYEARLAGCPGPWTSDPVLRNHRFTNCFRASDRVSQFLIRDVAYGGSQRPDELVFRVMLFKLFNKIDTWQLLTQQLGFPTLDGFDVDLYSGVLDEAFSRGHRLYSAAYVVPPPQLGADRKHRNHLRLLRHMLDTRLADQLCSADSMQDAFAVLKSYPAIGDFLAFQFLIDINYSTALDFDEMDFVVAGPGARDGIRKCFGPSSAGKERELIEYMATSQTEHFARLGLQFGGLFGRPLQLIDCQNLFCEVDKYARVMHPEIAGYSGRTRIKQKFRPVASAVSAWFPPKWRLTLPQQRVTA
ncbi:putative DNA base hypermodification protein [Mycolicibacterium sp. 120266]|uniref:nucleotide kinase domain-containing protein n=1 Tax=Mycolicibacterium sp. 120266 TaxID=3090601 RepID=UPI00299E85C5|nr:nucleotide kinase domain-containing protein [Mycolicibacterium sp. 120266]MDX1873289.1 putative DNA base hypermodification protein [Mycolicibacterium sp. 120266]